MCEYAARMITVRDSTANNYQPPRLQAGTGVQKMADQKMGLDIPEDVSFGDLQLSRNQTTGDVSFDLSTINRICDYNDIDIRLFTEQPEDNIAGLIVAWYNVHRKTGGDPDPVAEQLIAEVSAEDQYGAINIVNGAPRQ